VVKDWFRKQARRLPPQKSGFLKKTANFDPGTPYLLLEQGINTRLFSPSERHWFMCRFVVFPPNRHVHRMPLFA